MSVGLRGDGVGVAFADQSRDGHGGNVLGRAAAGGS